MTQVHMKPKLIPLIKIKHYDKSDKYFVKLKLCRDPTSDTSNPHAFKIYLFINDDWEELLLFVKNFNMNIATSVILGTDVKVQYLRTLFCGEALRQFDLLSADVEGINPLTVETIILGLAPYYFPVNVILKKKCVMRRRMRKPHGLK